MKYDRKFLIFVMSLLLLSSIVLLLYIILRSDNLLSGDENRLVRSYIIENGFLVNQDTAIGHYSKIFLILEDNRIPFDMLKKDDPVSLGKEDVDKLFTHLINGAKCKSLGLREPGKMASFTSYESSMEKMLKFDNLFVPLLKGDDVQKEKIVAFMALGEQLCEYDDVIVNANGIRCKYDAVKILGEGNSVFKALDQVDYSNFKTEIEDDFRKNKNRASHL